MDNKKSSLKQKITKRQLINDLLLVLSSIFSLFYFLNTTPKASKGLFLGLSRSSLLIGMVICLLLVLEIFLLLSHLFFKHPRLSLWAAKAGPVRLFVGSGLFLVFFTLTLLPASRFGYYAPHYTRLTPLFLWFCLLFLQELGNQFFWHDKIRFSTPQNRRALILFSGILAVLLGAWLLVSFSGWGLTPSGFWEKNGVPVLFLQTLWAVWGGYWLSILSERFLGNKSKLESLFIFILLWAAAGLVWNSTPMGMNGFNPGPFPPDGKFYPRSDAAAYDMAAQYKLINGYVPSVDKPLYSAFLWLIHLVDGQNFNLTLLLHCSILAVLCPIIYLLGKELGGRTAGITAALICLLRVRNMIAGGLVIWKVSNPRMQMTEIPLAVLLALLLLVLMRLSKARQVCWGSITAAGGLFGLAALIRHNVWIFFPFILLFFIILYRKNWKEWLSAGLVFLTLEVFLTLAPWMLYSWQSRGTPLFFMDRFESVVMANRYETTPLPLDQTKEISPTITQPAAESAVETTATITPTLAAPLTNPTTPPISADLAETSEIPPSSEVEKALLSRVNEHFWHNLVASVFQFPSYLSGESFEQSFGEADKDGIWGLYWDGSISLSSKIILLFNLAFLTLGITLSVFYASTAGWLPLAFVLIYFAGNAAALTSGGRYLVPIDWAASLYWSIGLSACAGFLLDRSKTRETAKKSVQVKNPAWSSLLLSGLFLVAGLLPYWMVQRTENKTSSISEEDIKMVFTSLEGAQNVETEDLLYFEGRLLYPRWLDYANDPNANEIFRFLPQTENLLTFYLIGDERYPAHPPIEATNYLGTMFVVIALDSPPNFELHAQEVYLRGAITEGDYFQAFSLYLPDKGVLLQADN